MKIFTASMVLLFIMVVILLLRGCFPLHDSDPGEARARQAIGDLITATDGFYGAYSVLPFGSENKSDTVFKTTGRGSQTLMNVLVGIEDTVSHNSRLTKFFSARPARNRKDGLELMSDSAEFFDPWGHAYRVMLDLDGDEKLEDPFTGEVVEGRRVIALSLGEDGKSGTYKADQDNVCSWK